MDGGWESPMLLKPLRHRNDFPQLLVDMHLVGQGEFSSKKQLGSKLTSPAPASGPVQPYKVP
jgi:hypothetical protein